MLPSLSIVIPTYNRADLLQVCLRTIQQHAPPGVEVIVVDDASPGEAASQVVALFPNFRCLRLPARKGFAVAANAGLRMARGEIVEILNDDTEVTTGWAEAALAEFQDSSVGAVAPLGLIHPKAGNGIHTGRLRLDSAGDRYYVGGVAAKRWHGRALDEVCLKPGAVFGASASSAFYRRTALLEAGGFPESFSAYFEDVDVAFRLHWAGWETKFTPASRVYHHVSSSYRKHNRRLLEVQSRNEERIYWRNTPGGELARSLPRHLQVLLGKALLRWNEGTLLPFLWGRLRVLAEVGELRRHRQQLLNANPTADWNSWQIETRYWGQQAAT
ncbi:hypothetical protein BH10PLA2_BH10PLA2_05510 [soil metagenome]